MSPAPLRVLLLTQFFDPEQTVKGLAFAKALRDRGCDVEVLTGFPNYPGGKIFDGYRLRLYQRDEMDGIPVHRVWLYPSHDQNGKRRAMNYASFALSAAANLWRVRKPDVVYVHHPPATIGMPARLLRSLRGAPFVYEVQDMWPDTISATGMMTNPRLLGLIGGLMQRIYRKAARIVVISDGFKRLLIERGVPEEKIDVVRNWAEEGRLDVRPRDPALARELGIEAPFVAMFAGTMGKAAALDTLLEAAKLVGQERPDALFAFVGGGIEIDRLKARVADEGFTNVRFVDRQPMERMGSVLPLADVVLVHLRDVPLNEITISSKTQGYLAAGVPIVMGVRGDAARIVADSDGGILAEPENARSMADAILRVAAMSREERLAMGARGKAYYDAELSLSVGTDRYMKILRKAAGKG